MNKKLICLFLSLILLMGVLTGCAEENVKETITVSASADAKTLAMYLMTEAPVNEATAERITAAVNQLTQSKFKTKLVLYFYTEEEYYNKLEEAFAAREEARANGTLIDNSTDEDEIEDTGSEEEDDGVIQIIYPEIADYQVDIFYLGGKDRFDRYMEMEMLSSIDSSLSSASKKLTQYISPQFFSGLKAIDGKVYAVPTNRAIGEYTYLLLHKEALASAYMNTNGFTSLTAPTTQEFLKFINDSENLSEKYVPLWTEMSEVEALFANLKFWGVDENGDYSDTFSVLGNYFTNNSLVSDATAHQNMLSNLFQNPSFVSDLRALKKYQLDGYYATEADANKPFAVGLVQGGAELVEIYGDEYEMITVETPRMETEDLYSDLFGVCSYTSDVSRSMEILTYLNTDEEIRNLLLYGVEGEDYQLIDTGEAKDEFGETYKVVRKLTNNYVMSPNKTGNVFITYPLETEDTILSIHEYGVQQNQVALASMSLGFAPYYEGDGALNTDWMQSMRALSVGLLDQYNACQTMDEFEAFVVQAAADVDASEAVLNLLNPVHVVPEEPEEGEGAEGEENEDTEGEEDKNETTSNKCDKKCGSLKCFYDAWRTQLKF